MLIYLRLKNGKDAFQSLGRIRLDPKTLGKSVLCNLRTKKFNSSYYGDPYSYDWYNSDLSALKG